MNGVHARVDPPGLSEPARWSPRTGVKRDVNILQLRFKVQGNPADYFLTVDEVLRLHADLVEAFGGSAGLRDIGLLESALAQPRQGFALLIALGEASDCSMDVAAAIFVSDRARP